MLKVIRYITTLSNYPSPTLSILLYQMVSFKNPIFAAII